MKKYHYAYEVVSESMCVFISRIEQLGGFNVEVIKDLGNRFLIILSREDYYPYLTNQLKDCQGVIIK